LDDAQVAIFFMFLLLSPMIINSYAVSVDQLKLFETPPNFTIYDFEINSNSRFDLGLVIGITIGVAIEICFIFIIRQKIPKSRIRFITNLSSIPA
jgi:hypothetical protein